MDTFSPWAVRGAWPAARCQEPQVGPVLDGLGGGGGPTSRACAAKAANSDWRPPVGVGV